MTETYYTARHLLQALQALDDALLDAPLVLIHGKTLDKPNLIHGFLPALTPCDQATVDSKKPSLLTLARF
jgi:hypothetical protein